MADAPKKPGAPKAKPPPPGTRVQIHLSADAASMLIEMCGPRGGRVKATAPVIEEAIRRMYAVDEMVAKGRKKREKGDP